MISSVVKYKALSQDIRIDSEYYKPEFLEQARALEATNHKTLSDLTTVTDGNHLRIAEEFSETGVRYLRGQDLADFFISDADPIYIPESLYAKLGRSHICPGDVLVSIVGTIGSVGLVTDRHGQLTGNCKLAIVRPDALPGEYIATFLASKVGQKEIQRRIRGAVQMGLLLPDLKSIPIAIPNKDLRDYVVGIVQQAQKSRECAVKYHEEAQDALLSAIGLEKLNLSMKAFTYSRLSKAFYGNRLDPEFFCLPNLEKWKCPHPLKRLGDSSVTSWLSNGATPAESEYAENGIPILKVGGIGPDGIAEWLGDRVSPEATAARGSRGKIVPGDIGMLCAAHHVRYIGKSGLFTEYPQEEMSCRSVGELITVRSSGGIRPEVLCTYFNLAPIRLQSQRYVRGQSAHLYPSDLAELGCCRFC
jgi:hypothetical protein